MLVGSARVFERLDHVVSAKARRSTWLRHVAGAERRADRARLARVRMHHDLGVLHLRTDEIDLSFDYGEVEVCAALQNELASGGGEVLQLPGVDPHVER